MPKIKKEDNEENNLTVQAEDIGKNLLGSLLRGFKDDLYNHIENNPIKVSMGSLLLDHEITLTEGIHRFVGFTSSGKTSEAFLVMKNMMEQDKNSKCILVKSEGRLSENIQKRSGLNFVFDSKDWNTGTVFVLETNIFDVVCPILELILKDSYTRKERIGIIIDSVDALRLKADNEKELGSEKVAGPQGLMKRFLSKMSLPIGKYGAICIAISQVSSNIRIDPYSKEPPRITSGGGGYGLLHFANYILEFEPRFNSDNILLNPSDKKVSEKNPIIGHWACVTIKKSDKENEGTKIKYPIKHGREGGNSIWIEYELCDLLVMYELVKKSTWCTFNDDFLSELQSEGFTVEKQHHGIDNLRKYLESNPELTKHLFNKFKNILNK